MPGSVPSLPTRNGNIFPASPSHAWRGVPSLPTRNGNRAVLAAVLLTFASSQPTYKEWKRRAASTRCAAHAAVPSLPTRNGNMRGKLAGMVFSSVPSLPTRNGNARSTPTRSSSWWFPAYLQGMETQWRAGRAADHRWFPAYLQGMETNID